jgi:hypothetical protein
MSPLPNFGDALRLAITLGLEIIIQEESTVAAKRGQAFAREKHNGDPYAATLRAIYRAAKQLDEK